MRGKRLRITALLLIAAAVAFTMWRAFRIDPPASKVQRLLAAPPDTLHLATPLWDYTTTQALNWKKTPLAEGWFLYAWSGQLETDPDLPNLTIRSGVEILQPLPSGVEKAEPTQGYRLEGGIRRRLEILPFSINRFSPKAYPVYLPSGSCKLTFDAARVHGALEEGRLGWEIEGEEKGSFAVVSHDFDRLQIALSRVEPATRIFRLRIDWKGGPTGTYELSLRDFWLESTTRIEAVLPEGSATPEVWFRPREPASLLLSGSPSLYRGTPEFVPSPWKVYDEDDRWVRPVDINGIVRTGILLPTPSRLKVAPPPGEWDSLVFYPGVKNPYDPEALSGARLRVAWETPRDTQTLWEGRVGHIDPRESMPEEFFKHVPLSWQSRNPSGRSNQPEWRRGVHVLLPDPVEGEGANLLFESIPKDASSPTAPVFLGEPLLLPEPRYSQGELTFEENDLLDGKTFLGRLHQAGQGKSPSPAKRTHLLIDWKIRVMASRMTAQAELDEASRRIVVKALNEILSRPDFYIEKHFSGIRLSQEGSGFLKKGVENLEPEELQVFNRELLELGFPRSIRKRSRYQPAGRPDVLLISLDTLRGDSLSCLGYYRDTTPWMTSYFGHRGIRFTNAEAPSTWTLPSHAGLFLSQFISRHGIKNSGERIGTSSRTLAEYFAEKGYETAAFADRGFLQHTYGFYQGFETYDQLGGGFASILPRCERWLEERAGSNPLLLFLHTYDIHAPYSPPPPFFDRFLTADMQPSNPGFWVPGVEILESVNRRLIDWTPSDVDYARAVYDGGILYTDSLLRGFFKRVEENALLNDPLVIVFSDHGEGFGEHDFWGHGWTLYEEMTHVPVLMRFPNDQYAGAMPEDRISLIDVGPTVFDFLDWEWPPDWQGTSVLPLLEGKELDPNRVIYSELLPFRQAMYRKSLKLVKHHSRLADRKGKKVDPIEAFDLVENPVETRNLVHDASRQFTAELSLMEKAFQVMAEQRSLEGNVESAELDPGTIEELKALGYLK
jgi:arylsulfatase A-like enzyme